MVFSPAQHVSFSAVLPSTLYCLGGFKGLVGTDSNYGYKKRDEREKEKEEEGRQKRIEGTEGNKRRRNVKE